MYGEEVRVTETELEKEIEGEGHHPTGTWAMNLEEAERPALLVLETSHRECASASYKAPVREK